MYSAFIYVQSNFKIIFIQYLLKIQISRFLFFFFLLVPESKENILKSYVLWGCVIYLFFWLYNLVKIVMWYPRFEPYCEYFKISHVHFPVLCNVWL